VIFVNRLLYYSIAVFFILAFSISFIPGFSVNDVHVDAIKIKPVKLTLVENAFKPFTFDDRNFFDAKGVHWFSMTPDKNEFKSERTFRLLGVIHLPGVEGVMTDQGFVAVGQMLNGGRLLRIDQGKAIIDILGMEKILIIDDISLDNHKFKSLGFPFIK